jgi:hypothetical protein
LFQQNALLLQPESYQKQKNWYDENSKQLVVAQLKIQKIVRR